MNIPERISALRALMEERGYDVYMVPTDDFHQSEYVGDHFKVREYKGIDYFKKKIYYM